MSLLNAKPVDSAFTIANESACKGDPEGIIVGGAGKNVFSMYEFYGDTNSLDTLKNTVDPGTMLHGQWRRLEYNKDYFDGNIIDFRVQTSIEDTGKVLLTDKTGFGVTLKDTSVLKESAKVFSIVFKEIVIDGIKKLIPIGMFENSVLSRKIALKNAFNGFEYQGAGDFGGRAYTFLDMEECQSIEDLDKFLPRSYRENGKFSLSGSGRFKIHTSSRLSTTDIIWDSEKKGDFSPMNWDSFKVEILDKRRLWIEFKYIPNTINDVCFRYKHNSKQLEKQECTRLDIGSDYDMKFVSIYGKLASLCDCKSGSEINECRSEAYKLTEVYFKVWGLLANNEESFGIRKYNSQISTSDEIHSGWYCFHWAYSIHEVLNSINPKYFTIQRSAYILETPTGKDVKHNWITVFVCDPSDNQNTTGGIHLDPWIRIKIDAYTPTEHEALYGKRNFIGYELVPKEDLVGDYIDANGERWEINKKGVFNEW